MSRLKLLILNDKVKVSGFLNFLSNELAYLKWKEYPFTYLPPSFQPHKLVKLILRHSNIKELWQGIKDLRNLTHMELCYSKSLVKIPNLCEAPNLRHLNLKGCVKLVHLDASIGGLKKLDFLNMENCKNLVSIPKNIFDLNLCDLNLSGCSKLFENLRQSLQLNTSPSDVERHMTSFMGKTLTRPLLFFSSRKLPNSVGLSEPSLPRFSALVILDISFCNLVQIPDAIGRLHSLECLNIGRNNFVTLPHCIKELPKLRELNLQYCNHLKWIPSTCLQKGVAGGRVNHGGIYVFNCPSLSDTEDCRRTLISWMIKMIQVNMQSSLPSCVIQVVIPGSEIPRWFSKQNTGSSVKLDITPVLNDNNNLIIGIACCATFVIHDIPIQLPEEPKYPGDLVCGFHLGSGETLFAVPIRLKKDFIITELDHMVLIFFSRNRIIDHYASLFKEGAFDPDAIEIVANSSEYPEEIIQVKSCGYRWVFKEDLEQLNSAMIFSADSSAQNQKHKFLAIQDRR